MSKVKCIGKHILLIVEHNGVQYECVVCSGVKNLYECTPHPKEHNSTWTDIENIIRDAAWNLEIQDLDTLG